MTEAERLFQATHEFNAIDAIQAPVSEVDYEVPDFSLGKPSFKILYQQKLSFFFNHCLRTSTKGRNTIQLNDPVFAGRAGNIGLRRNITYIVAGIFVRNAENSANKHEVLLVQEAKESCHGQLVQILFLIENSIF
jgi:hypothetical protein